MSIAYLANRFPETLESYVGAEISELRKHGCEVVPCSVQRPSAWSPHGKSASDTRYIFPLRWWPAVKATGLCIQKFGLIGDLIWRAVRGPEPIFRRCRTLLHTWLGAYLATLLKKEKIEHIHVHHGYFSAWVGMVAARLLDAGFSLTLHGSDLLVRADYLDAKLADCRFCFTVSDFNLRYIAEHYPQIDPRKILVQRLGVDVDVWRPQNQCRAAGPFLILSVGRLHPTKNHAFLLQACAMLKAQGVAFRCAIAGEGDERGKLEHLVVDLDLAHEVTLLGQVRGEPLSNLYAAADVVVLTSRSEGIPVTLMEAMAMERVVLAPHITGIPELVSDGKTGFLYTPNSLEDFLSKLHLVRADGSSLRALQHASRRHVERYFNSRVNLFVFAECFLKSTREGEPPALEITRGDATRKESHENSVLQQVQLQLQRDRSLPV
jgi:glycosyltransferase involved in cell wall biosynthesis